MVNPEDRINNPYIIGSPIDEPHKFFGRRSLFEIIQDNLNQDTKIILLHGQRRIGKSSILQLIPQFLIADELKFFIFDLHEKSQSSLGEILNSLATEIILHLEFNNLRPPTIEQIDNDPKIFARRFLPLVYRRLRNKKLVLLLDEFDVVLEKENSERLPLLKELLDKQERLFIIPVVGRHPSTLQQLRSFLKSAPYQEIGLLDTESARRLITQPAKNLLKYEEEAINKIIRLSAGHPYFIQVICFTIFTQAREQNIWSVTSEHVDKIIDKALENAEAGLAWFWDGLPMAEQIVFSAIAEAHKIALLKNQQIPDDPFMLLEEYDLSKTEELAQASEHLFEKALVDDIRRRVKVEFVRLWLLKRHSLEQEFEKLQKLRTKFKFAVATQLYQEGKQQEAVALYEQIIQIDSNHVSSLLALAEIYLRTDNLVKAVEFYTRAYQVDQTSNKEKLLDVLERYGDKLKGQKKYDLAREQYNQALEIEPNRISTQEKLQLLDKEISKKLPLRSDFLPQLNWQGKKSLIGGIFAVACIAISLYLWSNPNRCSFVPKQLSGILCIDENPKNNISRGERAFFFSNPNSARDQGITAFKARDYSKAAERFKVAVTNDHNDPEVLIYYNNALALQQVSPITLAAVVPIENAKEKAQEILRGVAQAQNEFNANGGLNGRLLQIVIANDANGRISKPVAKELAQDESILGVIGHYTSDSTEKALPEYENAKTRLPVISPSSSSTKLKADVFFRATASDKAHGKKLAEYAWNNALKKVVIFWNPKSLFSRSITEQFITNFEKLGGVIVSNPIDLTADNRNVEQEVNESISQNAQAALLIPDATYVAAAEEIARVNANLKTSAQNQNKQGLKLLSTNILYIDRLSKVKAFDGLILSVFWFRDAPQSQKFAQAAKQQWRGGVSTNTATSYDATQAFIHALSSNPSRSTILQKLPQLNLSSDETSGEGLKFQDHERQGNPILIQVQNDQFKILPNTP